MPEDLFTGAIVFLGFPILLAVVWFFVFLRIRRTGQLERTMDIVLFLISVPKEEDQEKKEEKKDDKEVIAVTEQLLASLVQLKDSPLKEFFLGSPQISLEIANPCNDEAISFFIAVPKRFAAITEKQIYGFFPKALIERVPYDYNIFTPKGSSIGTYLKFKGKPYLPIHTYKTLDADPLTNITNALSKLKKVEEGAALQVIIRPASKKWRRAGIGIARKMKQGKSFHEAKRGVLADLFSGLIKAGTKRNNQSQGAINQYQYTQQELRQLTPGEEEMLKLIEAKTLRPSFEVNIRLMASAETKERAVEILSHLASSFSQFDTMEMNGFVAKKPISLKEMLFNFSFRNFTPRFFSVLNTEELASIFHFPIFSTETPKLKMVKSKSAPAPPNMPIEGLLIGKNVYRDTETNVYLKREDRRRHLYSIGQTGTGKSSFLEEMARQDIQNGEGVCIIDPHGELIESLLGHIPKNRIEDVILFDPSDVEMPMGLNLLEYNRPEQKTFVINEMINIFDKLYDLRQTGGPMFEQYMRNAMLLVMEHPESGSTLMEISKVLSDAEFRKFKLDHCKNQIVKDFWIKEAEKAGGEAALVNMVPYITSKLTTFITNDIMRPIISQQKSAFNFREAMDTGKIVLVNLSKGKIGELNANLLGMVIVGKILMSAMSRVDIPQENRRDFYLYIDEFQNVTTSSISSILSEARKYRLNLIIAHQFIQQLEEKIRDSVFGNVGSMLVFRIGAQDAEFIAKQFFPVFSENDLINADNYKAFAKVMIDGEVSKAFSVNTFPPKEKDYRLLSAIKEYSRKRYGKSRELAEKEMAERLSLTTQFGFEEEKPETSGKPIDSDMPVK